MNFVNLISAISIPIELYFNELLLGPATAFCYKKQFRTFLVSNWHVFSGRNAQTGQPLNSKGGLPNKLKIKLHGNQIGEFGYGWNLPLQDENGEPLWLQHSSGQNYDIACIECPPFPEGLRCYTIEDHKETPIRIEIGQDIMIVGFPRGLAAQGIWPIWKRGTLAAEPHIERLDKLPIYLVDAASREGMSGSPVYLFGNGSIPTDDGSLRF